MRQNRPMPTRDELWPPLPYEEWKETRDTLQMELQMLGKIRYVLAPVEPEWSQVALYVTARGLTTSPIPHPSGEIFDLDLDLISHRLDIRRGDGRVESLELRSEPVAEFYRRLMASLEEAGLPVEISTMPSEFLDPIPFPDDTVHATYDAAAVTRFHRALLTIDAVLKAHRARFLGQTSLVHLFWGSFDLTTTRYAGPEHFAEGFWPGDAKVRSANFYAYASPKPDGLAQAALAPAEAYWNDESGLFLLPYDAVRLADDPRAALTDFLESTYQACAQAAGWDPAPAS
jgi:hypothetical protein